MPEKKKKSSSSNLLVRLAQAEGLRLFCTKEDTAYALLPVAGKVHCWPLHSRPVTAWLRSHFFIKYKKALSAATLADALGVLEAEAMYHSTKEEVWLRSAQHEDALYLDLCDTERSCVKVTSASWTIEDKTPIYCRRAFGMKPLPRPVKGYRYTDLFRFVNIDDDDTMLLLLAWITASYRPFGPYPVLLLTGEQGSAKSTSAQFIRDLIDPSMIQGISEPRSLQELHIAADNSWVLLFDNMSVLPGWLSDSLCRLSTGGGFRARKLFKDREEELFDAMRPIIVTSIEEVITRGDLLERSIILNLRRIQATERQLMSTLRREFEILQPGIFGALLSITSEAMRLLPSISAPQLPRMADFALWGMAVGVAIGYEAKDFLAAYDRNQSNAKAISLESSSLTMAIQELLRVEREYEGTASALMDRLRGCTNESASRSDWPRRPDRLSGSLRRLAPSLYQIGIIIDFKIVNGTRIIQLKMITEDRATPATPATPTPFDDD